MAEIAQLTFDTAEFFEIMDMIDRRLNDKGKNWRHVMKALTVLDYCVHAGSENVVAWSKDNIYIIKTLREFQYIDEEGVDQGQNVRIKAKDITALLMDEERLRNERKNRSYMKNRFDNEENIAPTPNRRPNRRGSARRANGEEEMQQAIEESKRQAEQDNQRRSQRVGDEDELAKAIKLSKEEDESRQREVEANSSNLLFDDYANDQQDQLPQHQQQQQQQYQPYQQQQQVDFFGNPVYDNIAPQSTGYLQNVYSQPTGYQAYPTNEQQVGYGMPEQTQPHQNYSGANNPYGQQATQPLAPAPTGSNNPFAQFGSFNKPPAQQNQQKPTLNSLAEQQYQQQYQQQASQQQYASPSPFSQYQAQAEAQSTPPPQTSSFQKPSADPPQHQKLAQLLQTGGNQDSFGNMGNARIPAQHTAPGHYIHSSLGYSRPIMTGSNPFLQATMTGAPSAHQQSQSQSQAGAYPNYGAPRQQNGQSGSLIDF